MIRPSDSKAGEPLFTYSSDTLNGTLPLQEEAVVRKFRTTATDGKTYMTNFYNLDMIIALGYRVSSQSCFVAMTNLGKYVLHKTIKARRNRRAI